MSSPNDPLALLDAQLAAFAHQVVDEGAPAAAQAAAAVLLAEVQARAPEHSGELKAALQIVQASDGATAIAAVSVADSQKGGDNWHAVLQEYGTARMPARPFMRPAFDAAKDAAAQAAAQALQQTLLR